MEPLTVQINIPTETEHWHYMFCFSLMRLIQYCERFPIAINGRKVQVRLGASKNTMLPVARQRAAEVAVSEGAEYLLCIDRDMIFPADTLHCLIKHPAKIIAANCVTKTLPAYTTARLKSVEAGGDPVFTGPDDKGKIEVWRVGTGVMLIKTEVFSQIPRPWFDYGEWNEELKTREGEDWFFVRKAEEAGIKTYVEQGLSSKIFHIGSLFYGHDMVGRDA